ncbi:MAG: HAMP domain-containing protein [Fibrobacteres bacterium]|nr:HAMP domain-containing protein [Fibrobacterota bacterium]
MGLFQLKKNSLSYKTTISYLILTVVNVSLFTIMIFENQFDLINQNTSLNSETKSNSIRMKIDAVLADKKEFTTEMLAIVQKELKGVGIYRFSVIKENCEIVADVLDGKIEETKRQADKEEIAGVVKAIQKNNFENKMFYHIIDRANNQIQIYVPVPYGLDKTIVIKALLSLNQRNEKMRNLIIQCVVVAVLVVFIHIISALFLTKAIIEPLKQLADATMQISQGDIKARVNIVRDDEIGELAIAFNEMTVALQRMREQDRGANPLTGLPGNITIAQEIDRRLRDSEQMAVVYADLDNFKAYNDKYGFTRGDDVILYSRDCFVEAAKSMNDKRVFTGHEGGDDFVAVLPYELWEPYCKAVIGFFDHDITQFYNDTDAKNGYIESVSRLGERMRFPLMTISLAIVTNHLRPFSSHVELVTVAAEMKKVAKKMEGSSYAIDRRKA